MIKKKITYSLVCASVLLAGGAFYNPGQTQAAGSTEKENPYLSGSVDLNKLDETDESVTVEEITYEEYVKEIAENKGISEQDVRKQSPDLTKPTNVRSTVNSINKTSDFQIQAYTIQKISISQDVTSTYKPIFIVYAYTYSSGSAREYKNIQDITLNRSFYGNTKQFSGTMKAQIPYPTKISWNINGKFYDNGSTSWTTTGIGTKSTTSIGKASGGSKLYRSWIRSGTHSAY
ncbi:hypothetical protein [Rossellomorea marisflavi]|uniref:hypothetical protein n=1 Tax=Rossellomorea marisflavi TaxID=189381 RepID=UPI0034595143